MRAGYLWDKRQEYLVKRSSCYIGELVLPRPKYPFTQVQSGPEPVEKEGRGCPASSTNFLISFLII